ncbi:MAG: hypothetical protein ACO23H_07575 [Alphaproteobacteria bacterium]|nr:hypothetical protein [Rhodobacterales bacterium]NCX28492.1 hypothetical protein [Rhodobacterales bacterium]
MFIPRFRGWSMFVAFVCTIIGLVWIIGCLFWPDVMPRADYFLDGMYMLIGGTLIGMSICVLAEVVSVIDRLRQIEHNQNNKT